MLVRARGGYRPGSSTGAFAYCGTTRACETLPLVQLLLHGVLHCGARWRVSTPSSRQSKRQSSNQPQRRVVCSRAPRTDYRKPPLRASSTSNGREGVLHDVPDPAVRQAVALVVAVPLHESRTWAHEGR